VTDEPTDQPAERDAQPARVWRQGDGPTRTRRWDREGGPHIEVRVDGQWRAARLMVREDRGGAVLVHVDIRLPGHAGPVRRLYVWDPAAIRVVEDAFGQPVDVEWDAEGRVTGRAHPSA
jgi:hypothetical protein